jgi:hypothetical protein
VEGDASLRGRARRASAGSIIDEKGDHITVRKRTDFYGAHFQVIYALGRIATPHLTNLGQLFLEASVLLFTFRRCRQALSAVRHVGEVVKRIDSSVKYGIKRGLR